MTLFSESVDKVTDDEAAGRVKWEARSSDAAGAVETEVHTDVG